MIVNPSNLLRYIKSANLKFPLGVKKLLMCISTQPCIPSGHTCPLESLHHSGDEPTKPPHNASTVSPSDSAKLTALVLFLLVLSW